MANKKQSPFKWLPLAMAAVSVGTSIFGAISANKQRRIAERKEREARREMDALKSRYANLDTSNPFLNLENTMEDLTINQQQANFEKQQFQQSQANILSGLRGAAGSSGVAALAQTLAQQGQLAAQRSSASIGQQEAANQMAERQVAGQIQGMERQGEMYSRNLEREKTETLLGMSQQETAAYGQQAGEARQQMWSSIAGGVEGAANMFAGFGGGERPLAGFGGGQFDRFGNIAGPYPQSSALREYQRWNTNKNNNNTLGNVVIGG